MRILFLTGGYPPKVKSGGGVAISGWARALAQRGHEVHVLECRWRNQVMDERDGEVTIHRRRPMRVRGVRRLRRLLLPRRVRRSLRQRKIGKPDLLLERAKMSASFYRAYRRLRTDFDVVLIPDGAYGLGFALLRPAAIMVMFHAPALLVTRRGGRRLSLRARMSRSMDRFVLRRADLLVAMSPLLVRVLKEEGWLTGCPPVKFVPVVIDPAPWSSIPPVRETSPRVLQVGTFHREKAPEVLVEAAAYLADQVEGLDVVFVGDSEDLREGRLYRDWLVEEARRLGAPCSFLDPRPHPEMPPLYGACRVVAIPSRFDAFPLVGLEAMAAGRPLVCTSEVGLCDLVCELGAGAVVPPDDPRALAAALKAYLENAEAATSAGERGRAFVAGHLTPAKVAKRLEALCQEAVRSGRTSGVFRRRRAHLDARA